MGAKQNKCCCCDPCNTIAPAGGCCACIPRRLCAVFEAYGCACDGAAAYMEKDVGVDEYRGSIGCAGETMDVTVSLYRDPYDPYQQCYWRVESYALGIDDLFPIDSKQDCDNPDLQVAVAFYECSGTLHITRHNRDALPQEKDYETGLMRPWCGDCACICHELCYVEFNAYTNEIVESILTWEKTSKCWTGAATVCLDRDEYTNACLLRFDVFGRTEYVEIADCREFFATVFEVPGNDHSSSVTISCRRCECGVPSNCCNTVLPSTLHVTFLSEANAECDCADGVVVPVQYWPGTSPHPVWIGRGPWPCSVRVFGCPEMIWEVGVYVACLPTGEFELRLIFGNDCDDPFPPLPASLAPEDFSPMSFVPDVTPVCDPFEVRWTNIAIGDNGLEPVCGDDLMDIATISAVVTE